MVIFIILLLVIILIFVAANNGKTETQQKNNLKYDPKLDYVLQTELRIQESKKLLEEIREKYPKTENNFGNFSEFEVTGIHIENRKKYILDNCNEYDEVTLKHEKNNKFSNRAIVVKHNNKIIGYIPESEVEEVHEIIKNNFEAKISEIDYDGSFLNIKINIEY